MISNISRTEHYFSKGLALIKDDQDLDVSRNLLASERRRGGRLQALFSLRANEKPIPKKQDTFSRKQTPRSGPNKSEQDLENKLFLIAGPELENKNLQIKQDTKLYLGKIKKGQTVSLASNYEKNEDFLFVIEGNIRIGNENIEKRDAYFKFDSTPEKIQATEDSFILFANSKA